MTNNEELKKAAVGYGCCKFRNNLSQFLQSDK